MSRCAQCLYIQLLSVFLTEEDLVQSPCSPRYLLRDRQTDRQTDRGKPDGLSSHTCNLQAGGVSFESRPGNQQMALSRTNHNLSYCRETAKQRVTRRNVIIQWP